MDQDQVWQRRAERKDFSYTWSCPAMKENKEQDSEGDGQVQEIINVL